MISNYLISFRNLINKIKLINESIIRRIYFLIFFRLKLLLYIRVFRELLLIFKYFNKTNINKYE